MSGRWAWVFWSFLLGTVLGWFASTSLGFGIGIGVGFAICQAVAPEPKLPDDGSVIEA